MGRGERGEKKQEYEGKGRGMLKKKNMENRKTAKRVKTDATKAKEKKEKRTKMSHCFTLGFYSASDLVCFYR